MNDHGKVEVLMHTEQRDEGWFVIVRIVPVGRRDLPDDHPDVQWWQCGPIDTEEEVCNIRDAVRRNVARMFLN